MIVEEVIRLEKLLLNHSTRINLNELYNLISDDFVEFGSSGKIYNKQEVIASLLSEEWRDFRVSEVKSKILNKNCVLITYKLFEGSKVTLRSSVWMLQRGQWQIIFHQGTIFCL